MAALAGGAANRISSYKDNTAATAAWTVSPQSRLPDGAFLSNSTRIVTYDANLAAIALAQHTQYHPQVQSWMAWYVSHLNRPDKWGLSCTVYDYNVAGSTLTPANDADSTDSYAATFLSLAWTYWRTGDETAHRFLTALKSDLECIANVMFETQQDNGLTWAKPDYKTAYLMDNAEVYRGLKDAAELFETAFHDHARSNRYSFCAVKVLHGIANSMWDPVRNNYHVLCRRAPR